MLTFLATTLAECNSNPYCGVNFWTAGQRVDPNSESKFIWRVTTEDGNNEAPMTYTNWEQRLQQPDYWRQEEACVHILGNRDYKWNDIKCHYATCSLCEIDTNCERPGE